MNCNKTQFESQEGAYDVEFYVCFAKAFGINEGIILSVLYQLNKREEWVGNTYEDWHNKYFRWLSPRAISIIFRKLEKADYVKSSQPDGFDKKKYYQLNKDTVQEALEESERG